MWLDGARGRLGEGGSFATATRFLVDGKGASSCMRVSPFFSAANCVSFSFFIVFALFLFFYRRRFTSDYICGVLCSVPCCTDAQTLYSVLFLCSPGEVLLARQRVCIDLSDLS